MKEGQIWGAGSKGWAAESAGDDPTVRIVHPPTGHGPGAGLGFFFLFGLNRHRKIDQDMVAREREAIADDIAVLTGAGFTVIVDPQATKADLVAAVTGAAEAAPAGVYWSAHGHPDGSIEACDGVKIAPAELAEVQVSPTLRLFVMSACYSAARSRTWRRSLGGHPLVVGWGRPVSIDRAVDFLTPTSETESGFDDLVRRYLLEGEPLPGEQAGVSDQPAWKRGTTDRLQPLLPSLAEILDAKHRVHEGALELLVDTSERRNQVVRVCTVQSEQPLFEGHLLFAAESEVGELAGVVDPSRLLHGAAVAGLARVALVDGPADLPSVLVQGFLPLQGATVHQLAGVVLEVAQRADDLEAYIFGADIG